VGRAPARRPRRIHRARRPTYAAGGVKRAVNPDKVDGLHAAKNPTPGRLLALDGNAKLLASVLPTGVSGPKGATGPKGNIGPKGDPVRLLERRKPGAALGEERERLWQRWREIDKNLDGYATLRPTETAVVVLEPPGAAAA
jgi:hypothetical protein